MREGEGGTQAWTLPTNQTSCTRMSYLHVCDSGVRLMPSEMEYDIFAHADTECASAIHWARHRKRKRGGMTGISADWFIYFTAFFFSVSLSVFVGLDAPNATEPSQRMSVQLVAKPRRSQGGRRFSGISHHFIRLPAKCRPRPCFCPVIALPACAFLFFRISFRRAILRPSPLLALP